jgi:hypothetical protein
MDKISQADRQQKEWFWEKVGQEVGQVSKPLPVSVVEETTKNRNEVGQEVGQVSKPLPVRILDKAAQPAQPISPNFPKNQENCSLNIGFYFTNQYNVRNFYKVWGRR